MADVTQTSPYDALLLASFGGPEGPEQVMPFLENVLRGRSVPPQRLQEVAGHYAHVGGVSPINEQNRRLLRALEDELRACGIDLPMYWGNRNWHPLLVDTMEQMATSGVKRALALVTSAFGSYSGCRQYLENLADAAARVGAHAPHIDKIRLYYNHPGFIDAVTQHTRAALSKLAGPAQIVFTAHSIPVVMAQHGPYERQLQEACELVGRQLELPWQLAYQSRSGPAHQPWLEPDIADVLRQIARRSPQTSVVLMPIGFLSDHMEVVYDLDIEMGQLCHELGLTMVRAATVGTHRSFVVGLRQLIQERLAGDAARLSLGPSGPWPDCCPAGCCQFTPAARPG
jgi:ferrochelatase